MTLTTLRLRLLSPLAAYLLSPLLVALTTWLLLLTQSTLAHMGGGHVRPFGIGFLLAVALLTALGGRGPGVVTLALSVFSLLFVLMPRTISGSIGDARNWTELLFLICVGGLVVLGLEAVRKNASLLAESEEARARLRTVMDTAPVGVLISDIAGKLTYANREAERIWGHPLQAVGREGWTRYRLLNSDGTPARPEDTLLGRVLAGAEGTIQDERLIEQPDGTRVYVQTSATLVRDKSGRPLNGLVIFSDMTKRKQAEQEVQRLLARERLINKIGQISLQTLDPDLIQREAVEGLGRLLGVDRCYLRLYDLNRHQTRIGWEWRREDLPSIVGEYPFSEARAAIDSMYALGEPLCLPDTQDAGLPQPVREAYASLGVRAGLAIPLFDNQRLSASLVAVMVDQPHAWTAEDSALMEAVANQMRAAVESAHAQQRNQAIAEALQDALMPALPNRVAGLEMASYYRAALDEANVGGDFLDVFALEKGHVVFAVGDLSGKGLAAASQVATVRNMLRYSLYRCPRLDDAISELNNTVVEHELLTGFATLFVGVYDQGARTLTYLSCGHDPGLHRRAESGEIALLPPGGTDISPVLGLVEDGRFVQQTVRLLPGDTLFFCTDGVTEAGRSRGEFLGVAGVAEMLRAGPAQESVEELVARIVTGVRDYADGIQHDDICLLAAIVS